MLWLQIMNGLYHLSKKLLNSKYNIQSIHSHIWYLKHKGPITSWKVRLGICCLQSRQLQDIGGEKDCFLTEVNKNHEQGSQRQGISALCCKERISEENTWGHVEKHILLRGSWWAAALLNMWGYVFNWHVVLGVRDNNPARMYFCSPRGDKQQWWDQATRMPPRQ